MKSLRAKMSSIETGERRQSARWHVELIVAAGPAHDMSRVMVRNLSDKGLMLETDAVLDVGETITVELPDNAPVEARIVWREASSYGCEFLEPISSAAISAALLRAPLTGPTFQTSAPDLEEFTVGKTPSVEELSRWKAEFESMYGARGYRLVAFRQSAGGILVAVATREGGPA